MLHADAFLRHLADRGCSERTLKAYPVAIAQLEKFLGIEDPALIGIRDLIGGETTSGSAVFRQTRGAP